LAAPAPHRGSLRLRATARRVTVVHVAAVVGLATGGVALAAVAGVTPGLLPRPPTSSSSSVAPSTTPKSGASDTARTQKADPSGTPHPPIITRDPSPSAGGASPTSEAQTNGRPPGAASPRIDTRQTMHQPPSAPRSKTRS